MEKSQGAEKSKHKSKSDAGAEMRAKISDDAGENSTIEKEANKQETFDGVGTDDEHGKNADTDENIKVKADVEVPGRKVAFCSL